MAANGCSRWDLLDTVRCTWALRPDGIDWPVHDDGRPSFKLEHLTAANDLVHDAAHDALSDVRATIALARLVKERQPRLWDFCLKLRDKNAVRAEMGVGRPFLHLSGMYPVERGCMAVVWPLAPHPTNKNEVIVWDLSHDPAQLEGLDADTVRQRLYTRQDELPEGVQRLPIKTIHVNKSPIVIGNLKTLGAAAERWGIDLALADRHAQAAGPHGRQVQGLWQPVFAAPRPRPSPMSTKTCTAASSATRTGARCSACANCARGAGHAPAGLPGRAAGRTAVPLPRAQLPAHADDEEQQRWTQHCAARLHHGAGGAMTLAQFFQRIDDLAESADDRQQEILESLYDYGEGIAPEA
jgi:exodeoxyribonuclease-1